MCAYPAVSAADWDSRILTTTQSVKPIATLPAETSAADQMVSFRAAHMPFQLAVLPTTSTRAWVSVTNLDDACTAVSIKVYRVIDVYLPQGSSGMGTRAGWYPDGLAIQNPESQLGWQQLTASQAASWVVDTDIPESQKAGTCHFNVVASTPSGEVIANRMVTITIQNQVLPASGSILRPKLMMGWEMDNYKAAVGATDIARLSAISNSFLRAWSITPTSYWRTYPSNTGNYNCQTQMSLVDLLAVRAMPTSTAGCDASLGNADDYQMTSPYGSAAKQDDRLKTSAKTFVQNVAHAWKAMGIINHSTYAKNPFDEPSDVTPNMRYTMKYQVPLANTILHQGAPGVKVLLSSWPRDERKIRKCITVKGKRSCATFDQDQYGNRNMYDGGSNDPDVWAVQPSRLYGRVNNPATIKYHLNRNTEYLTRLKKVQNLGREIWSYNFYSATTKLPQTSIDAPAHHSELLMLELGREGFQGMYISNGLWYRSSTNTKQVVNPWDTTPAYLHSKWGTGYGWGSYAYPGYNPRLGLNDQYGEIMPSMRLLNMRQGIEDATALNVYRRLHGTALASKITLPFGKLVALPKTQGSTVWPFMTTNEFAASQALETMRHQLSIRMDS